MQKGRYEISLCDNRAGYVCTECVWHRKWNSLMHVRSAVTSNLICFFLVEVGATDVKVFELELNLARY